MRFVAMWACPHCGAPQAEAARCWVCHRSSTTCSTCRHFRTSLAADVGYCGKDRWRSPLTGLELRACWEEGRRSTAPFGSIAPASGAQPPVAGPALHVVQAPRERVDGAVVRGRRGPLDRPDPMRLRGFVPLDELVASPAGAGGSASSEDSPSAAAVLPPVPGPGVVIDPVERWDGRTSLFGEVER